MSKNKETIKLLTSLVDNGHIAQDNFYFYLKNPNKSNLKLLIESQFEEYSLLDFKDFIFNLFSEWGHTDMVFTSRFILVLNNLIKNNCSLTRAQLIKKTGLNSYFLSATIRDMRIDGIVECISVGYNEQLIFISKSFIRQYLKK